MKKKIFLSVLTICLYFFIIPVELFAQENDNEKNYFYVDDLSFYENGKTAFEKQDFGLALKLFNNAKSSREEKISLEVNTLENSFKPAEVKYAGDTISSKIPVLQEREDFEALEIIEFYNRIYTLNYFGDSPEKLVEFIRNQKNFPEADYYLGKIYQIEGEYSIAEKYFYNAYKYSDILQIPDEKYEILYSLAELAELKKDFNKMEEYLLLIVSKEPLFRDENRKKSFQKSISSNKKDCVEKFFKLYRAENFELLKPLKKLSDYYKTQNQTERSLYANALCVVTGFTRIIDLLYKRNPVFEYKNLSSFFDEVENYSDIVDWGIENELWGSFNSFAENAQKNSDVIFARELYKILKEKNPENYWKEDAKIKFVDLNIE